MRRRAVSLRQLTSVYDVRFYENYTCTDVNTAFQYNLSDTLCSINASKVFDILALYKSDYYYY